MINFSLVSHFHVYKYEEYEKGLLSPQNIFSQFNLKLVSKQVDPALVFVSSAIINHCSPQLSKLNSSPSRATHYFFGLPNTIKQLFPIVRHRFPSFVVAVLSSNHRIWTASPSDNQPCPCRRQTRRHAPPSVPFQYAAARCVLSTCCRPLTETSPCHLHRYRFDP